MAFHPEDNNLVASAGEDGLIKLVSRLTGTLSKVWNSHHGAVKAVAFSPEGTFIAAGCVDGTILVLGAETIKIGRAHV